MEGVSYSLFKGPTLKIYYFIGRLNPPHPGHISALQQMIDISNQDDSVPIILLGSGPNGGEITMDNPVSFELKKKVVETHLKGKFIIKKLGSPIKDVLTWRDQILQHTNLVPDKVEITLFAGDKGNNSTKFEFMGRAFNKIPNTTFRIIPIRPLMNDSATLASVMTPSSKPKEMSATSIRKFAYQSYLNELQGGPSGLNIFKDRWRDFYGDNCDKVYKEIVDAAQNLTNIEIDTYIKSGDLPSKKRKRSANKPLTKRQKEGGSKTVKHHTKKNKLLYHINIMGYSKKMSTKSKKMRKRFSKKNGYKRRGRTMKVKRGGSNSEYDLNKPIHSYITSKLPYLN